MFNVGAVQGYLKLDTKGWDRSMGQAGASLQALSRTFARFGAVAVGSLFLIEREFGKFDKAIRHATSVSETTNEQFEQMSMMALDASVRWNKAAASTAQAFYFLGSAGLTVSEQLAAFNDTVMLSRAMGSELGQTVEGVVDIVRAFGLEFANVSEIADQLTKTVISSNQQFRTLDQAMTYAASTARLTNNTLAETTAMLGVMANAGIKGSMAGTVLRRAMTNLMSPTGDMAELIYDLGLNIYDASGRMKPFINIMGEISDQLTTATDEYKNMVFEVLFGRRAIAGQIVLFNKGSVALRRYADEIKNSAGTTARVAGKQMRAFTEILGQLWREVQRVAIVVGGTLAPALERVSDRVRTNTAAFREYVEANAAAIANALKWVALIGGVLVVGAPLLMIITSLVGQMTALALVIANPFVALIASLYVLRAVWKNTNKEILAETAKAIEITAYKQIGPGGMAISGGGASAILASLLGFGPVGIGVAAVGGVGLGIWRSLKAKEAFEELEAKGESAILDLGVVWDEAYAAVTAQMKTDFGGGLDFSIGKLEGLVPGFQMLLDMIQEMKDLFMKEPIKGGLQLPTLTVENKEFLAWMDTAKERLDAFYSPKALDTWRGRWDNAVKAVFQDSLKIHDGITTALKGIQSDWATTMESFMNNGGNMKNFLDQMFSDILRNFNQLVAEVAANNLLYAMLGKRGAGAGKSNLPFWDKVKLWLFGPGVDTGLGSVIGKTKTRGVYEPLIDTLPQTPESILQIGNPLLGTQKPVAVTVDIRNETGVEAVGKTAGAPVWNGEEWVVGVVLNRLDTDPNFRDRFGR